MFGKARLIVRQVVGVVGGLLLGICLTLFFTGSGMQAQAPAPPPLQPPYRGLDANLYMISAEYRAICYQTFAWSRQLLETKLAQTQPGGKPFAVVADLDETLLDNSGFQTMQVRRNIAFDKSLWDVWQKEYGREVRLVPGAAEFVRDVRALHVDLVYVSNRDETYRAETRQLLADLGIGITHENQLKLATDTSNKNKRRDEAREQYEVLLYLGDNLRDFDDCFRTPKLEDKKIETVKAAIEERKKVVDEHRSKFGNSWVLLPNPVYGEWPVASTGKPEDVELLPAAPAAWRK